MSCGCSRQSGSSIPYPSGPIPNPNLRRRRCRPQLQSRLPNHPRIFLQADRSNNPDTLGTAIRRLPRGHKPERKPRLDWQAQSRSRHHRCSPFAAACCVTGPQSAPSGAWLALNPSRLVVGCSRRCPNRLSTEYSGPSARVRSEMQSVPSRSDPNCVSPHRQQSALRERRPVPVSSDPPPPPG